MERSFELLIQKRLDKGLIITVRIATLVAFIAAGILYFAPVSVFYAVANFATGCILLVFNVFIHKIQTKFKIGFIIVEGWLLAVLSFVGGQFESAFLVLLIICNVMAILFFVKKTGIYFVIVSLFIMLGLAGLSFYNSPVERMSELIMIWGLQFACFILLMVIFSLFINLIKQYLFENILDLREAVRLSNQLAYFDQATKLPNLYKFKIDVENRIQNEHKEGYIVLVHLNNLRMINSILGQSAGEKAINELAEVLQKVAGEGIIIARIASNEFAVWEEVISEEELYEKEYVFKNRLREDSGQIKTKLYFVGAYAKYNMEKDSFDDCMRRATLALSHAKSKNMNQLVAYTEEIEREVQHLEELKTALEFALKKEEFCLYYQEKIDVKTGKVVGVEALSRWITSEMGVVSPAKFIPIIESMNQSITFGKFVMRKAFEDYHKLQEKYGQQITLSINLSATHIMDPAVVQTIQSFMEQYNIPKGVLIIEITESILIEGLHKVRPIFQALRAMDVKISLDDFGTGYSSLNYLGQLEFDEIKIDKTFVDQMVLHDKMSMLIENTIRFANRFQLTVVAEGVEREAQYEMLEKLGCHIIQGFYYSIPKPLE